MDVRNGRSLSVDSVKFKFGKTSKFQILNILFWAMDFKFLESVIIDYLICVESYTVYVVWIHNTINMFSYGKGLKNNVFQ